MHIQIQRVSPRLLLQSKFIAPDPRHGPKKGTTLNPRTLEEFGFQSYGKDALGQNNIRPGECAIVEILLTRPACLCYQGRVFETHSFHKEALMRARFNRHSFILGSLIFTLAACEPGVVSKGAGFQRNYSTARKALEAGDYPVALKGYGTLIKTGGPLEPRLRLEYAHALLRANHYAEAARISGALANRLKGTDRAAALAVRGTAEHELALTAMAKGEYGPETRKNLTSARAALSEMLKTDPDLDPLGAMAERHKDITSELATLAKQG